MFKKRISAMLLAVLMVFSLGACKENPDEWSYYSVTEVIEKEKNPSSNNDDGGKETSNNNPSSNSNGNSNSGSSSTTVPGVSTEIVDNSYKKSVKPTVLGFAANYEIKYGDKAVDKDLDFGGKTITMAVCAVTSTYSRMVKAFENEYNCKIKLVQLNYSTYITQLASAVAAENSYDICGMQGDHFPTEAIKGLIEPLENAITTADLYDPKKPSLHAIDFDYSQLTSWDNHMYGVVGHGASVSQPSLLYYNKRLFKENGLQDPYELYKKGQWTWDKIKQMGKQVSNSTTGVYFLDGDCFEAVPYGNCCEWISYSAGGKITENLTATKNINAMKLIQELRAGNNPVMAPRAFSDNTTNFFSGKSFMFYQVYTYGQQYIRPAIQDGTATAFNGKVENMGIVPIPAGPDNKDGAYQTGALDYITCGKGKDPLPAIAWAKFKSSFDASSSSDKNSYTAEEWSLIENLANGKTYVNRVYGFSTTTTSASGVMNNILAAITDGADISSTLANNRSSLQNCIDTTLKVQ